MNCPICKNTNLTFVHKFTDTAVMQNKLFDSLESALKQKKQKFNLYGCKDCGFMFNVEFDPSKIEYSSNYDNTQENSPYFSKYIKGLVKELIKKYNLKNKNVIEIGCGKGGFLKMLYENGVKNIKGFDPAYVDQDHLIDNLVVRRYFDIKNIENKADFIICRHILEHIPDPLEFIFSIGKCLKDEGVIYFEFPSCEWIIKNKVFFDFFYEHCNYFSKRSIAKLFHQAGFKNVIFGHGLDGQYFQLEVSRNGKINYNNYPLINFKQVFQFFDKQIEVYKKFIRKLDNFIIWGAGAKGITFLNRLNVSRKLCKYVIDINPKKNKKFIPVTGQTVVFPEIIRKERVDNIIIMNRIYEKEIRLLAAKYNYKGKFVTT